MDDGNTTGLDYAVNRYLSSAMGRFLSADPYQASGGPASPQSWNRYSYVHGDPVNFRDPRGVLEAPPDGFCPAEYPDCGGWDWLGGGWSWGGGGGGGGGGDGGDGGGCGGGGGGGGDVGACPGTTDCSYYGRACGEVTDPAARAYYCYAAPAVCSTAGNSEYANCVRKCLQDYDTCRGARGLLFTTCQGVLHAYCFGACASCAL